MQFSIDRVNAFKHKWFIASNSSSASIDPHVISELRSFLHVPKFQWYSGSECHYRCLASSPFSTVNYIERRLPKRCQLPCWRQQPLTPTPLQATKSHNHSTKEPSLRTVLPLHVNKARVSSHTCYLHFAVNQKLHEILYNSMATW